MNEKNKGLLAFDVETSRVLDILASEIYDSPNALLRENVQNAYDAILEKCVESAFDKSNSEIRIQLTGDILSIEDNGIGMPESIIENNFWKPGSSGKHTERAKKAGVVGTFGIGAMANFGVCLKLSVESENIEEGKRWKSYVNKEELQIGKRCIHIDEISPTGVSGTVVTATLNPGHGITDSSIVQYLKQYVEFLSVPVFVGNTRISGSNPPSLVIEQQGEIFASFNSNVGGISFNWKGYVSNQNRIAVRVTDVVTNGIPLVGELLLEEKKAYVMAQCNSFGLAAVPINSSFTWGGTVNLSTLRPTAGREGLNRDSINLVNQLISVIDQVVASEFSKLEFADSNQSFLNYVQRTNIVDLARKIKIRFLPDDDRIELGAISSIIEGKAAKYYAGTNVHTMSTHSGIESPLLVLDSANPRRHIQNQFIVNHLRLSPVTDNVEEKKRYVESELRFSEISLLVKIAGTLIDDYGITNPDVYFADFSHPIPFLVSGTVDVLKIGIRRDTPEISPVLQCYAQAREVFDGFVKDFVRVQLYSRFQNYVPSTTRLGADALIQKLRRNKQLFSYEETDSLEKFLADIGMTRDEAKKIFGATRTRSQRQSVSQNQVADTSIIRSSEHTQIAPTMTPGQALPPINRPETPTPNVSLLTSNNPETELNSYRMFLSLSSKVFRSERDFFMSPHTTQVMWGEHRIILIFGHERGLITFYYDIELKDRLDTGNAGGDLLVTTTIITKDRIFVPIPPILESAFQIIDGAKEFSVRFETIINSSESMREN